jgi:hypothetical protein
VSTPAVVSHRLPSPQGGVIGGFCRAAPTNDRIANRCVFRVRPMALGRLKMLLPRQRAKTEHGEPPWRCRILNSGSHSAPSGMGVQRRV